MSETKDITSKVVAEVKDSAHLFFTPVRVIVNEFNKAVQQPSRDSSSKEQKPQQGPAHAR